MEIARAFNPFLIAKSDKHCPSDKHKTKHLNFTVWK
jgi:hypothetical protein